MYCKDTDILLCMKERRRAKQGVIGIDEVGRGPLAGPVTVCAMYLADPIKSKQEIFGKTIKDSKKLSKDNRINIFKTINKKRKLNTGEYIYAVSSRSANYIDRYGINKAIDACINSSLLSLQKKGVDIGGAVLNLDGGLRVKKEGLLQFTWVKGDEKYVEIALASIMAKVTRDRYMFRQNKLYSQYSFDKHVGYGTTLHREAIIKHGVTKEHRRSFLSKIVAIL